jgi:lipid-A-disaccharide synthase
MAEKQILIICGEPSGELHASALVAGFKRINPGVKFFGVGSSLLANAGAHIIYETKDLSVMGLFDVLKKLPRFLALKKMLLKRISKGEFNAVIFVDFSGFNLRLAKSINNAIPTIYYISPQVWASRIGRVETIKRYIKKMLVFFPFEKDFYKKYGYDVELIGHPLLDIVKPVEERKAFRDKLNIYENNPVFVLLPGSRKQEINKILPVMLKTAQIIRSRLNSAQFIIAKAPQISWDVYHRITHKYKLDIRIIEGQTYDSLNAADFALVCSGTATLETAILQKPFVLIYKMNLLSYLLYRPQIRLPYIGLANIVARKRIIEEFIQFKAQPQNIAKEVLRIMANPEELNSLRKDLQEVKESLGTPGAVERAVKIISDFINK